MNEFANLFKALAKIANQASDNIFSANHRAAMIRQHGGTMAEIVKVGFNKETNKAEIYAA